MPWANWVMLGWKTIETRTHKRLQCLTGRRIGIHASQKWDASAIDAARPYLTEEQIERTERFLRVGGALIGTVRANGFGKLGIEHEFRALIECQSITRYGTFLSDPEVCEAIPMRGKQGIWYVPLSAIRSRKEDLGG